MENGDAHHRAGSLFGVSKLGNFFRQPWAILLEEIVDRSPKLGGQGI